MAAEPALEPTIAQEEELDEIDEGEESDVYEIEGEEEADTYEPEEDEDEDGDGDEGVGENGPDNMTALLLGKQNGTARTEGYDEEADEDEDEDEEYHEDKEGSAENPIDLSSAVAGSKRGVDELGDGDAYGDDDDDDEAEEQIVAKKARV